MQASLIYVLVLQYLSVAAARDDDSSVVGAVIGSIAAVITVIIFFAFGYYCYRRNKQFKERARRYSTNNVNSSGSQGIHDDVYVSTQPPPPSYFQNMSHQPSNQPPVTASSDQPPSYSAHMTFYHTRTSGQPMMTNNLAMGLDNHAFLNRSISNFSDLPNMADVLLTSSRTSIPLAVISEGSHSKTNKFSDSARGDSIESKVTSTCSQYVYDNPQFSMPYDDDVHQNPKDVLNECFESYSDSEPDLPANSNMGGRWLESIKNQPTTEKQTKVKTSANHKNIKKSHKSSAAKTKIKVPPKTTSQQLYNKKIDHKLKVDSSDSGAEVSGNPRGAEDGGCATNETRLSKISSDSGLGEVSIKSKPNSKLKWDAVNMNERKLNSSLSTEV